jgi:hypothetical protein
LITPKVGMAFQSEDDAYDTMPMLVKLDLILERARQDTGWIRAYLKNT